MEIRNVKEIFCLVYDKMNYIKLKHKIHRVMQLLEQSLEKIERT